MTTRDIQGIQSFLSAVFPEMEFTGKDLPDIRLDTNHSATFIGCAPTSLKLSRVTGTLGGVAAPMYRKIGRKVVYDLTVLVEWLEQFENQPNTAS